MAGEFVGDLVEDGTKFLTNVGDALLTLAFTAVVEGVKILTMVGEIFISGYNTFKNWVLDKIEIVIREALEELVASAGDGKIKECTAIQILSGLDQIDTEEDALAFFSLISTLGVFKGLQITRAVEWAITTLASIGIYSGALVVILIIVGIIVTVAALTWAFADNDYDDLCNAYESWISHTNLDHPDLFIEIDYMTGCKPLTDRSGENNPTWDPRNDTLDYLVWYYESKGITLHILIDEELSFEASTDRKRFDEIEDEHHPWWGDLRRGGYVYVLFGSLSGQAGAVAFAQLGDGAFVPVYSAYKFVGECTHTEKVHREVALLMHEFGHCLFIPDGCTNLSCPITMYDPYTEIDVSTADMLIDGPKYCDDCWSQHSLISKWSESLLANIGDILVEGAG